TLFPYTTLFRSLVIVEAGHPGQCHAARARAERARWAVAFAREAAPSYGEEHARLASPGVRAADAGARSAPPPGARRARGLGPHRGLRGAHAARDGGPLRAPGLRATGPASAGSTSPSVSPAAPTAGGSRRPCSSG